MRTHSCPTLPIVYGGAAVEKASRSSVRLASDPALTGVTGACFDTNGAPSTSATAR